MGRLVTVATCNLNQWTLDWEGNTQRIIESIRRAKAAGAKLRLGPELEITGYGCLDHFLEGDTFMHSWEMLAKIIDHPDCQDIICDVGMPVRHRNIRFNARVLFYNRKILYIRPKQFLAQDGNYREMRYFTPWPARKVERYYVESVVAKVTGQDSVDIGDCVLSTKDTCIGAETCEELFTPNAPHIQYGLNGVEIFTNSSGSHFESRKQATRISLIVEATRMVGGIYLYANQRGCDGDRLYYDGGAMIIVNGKVLAQASRFSLHDVEVITATVDIEEVRSYRCSPSRGLQATAVTDYKRIEVDMRLSGGGDDDFDCGPSPEIAVRIASPAEEIALAPAAFLWDFLRRSPAAGFFIPLSGGIDSCATSVIVFGMCRLAFDAIHNSDDEATRKQALQDCRRICGEPEDSAWSPESPHALCGRIFHTCFMGSTNSSTETRKRAKDLARSIGAYHTDLSIDTVVSALTTMFTAVTQFQPRFKMHGGTPAENLALQNIQARLRMVIAYMFAQLLPTVRQRRGGGGLLVLGSANVDESLRGYLTKYDCSSADINPIGGISKTDLKMFIGWAQVNFNLPILQDFLDAVPTAELEPITESYVQSDEVDMGMTYAELSVFGILRKVHKLGPWGMYERLLHLWSRPSPPETSLASSIPNGVPTQSKATATTQEIPDSVHAAIQGRGLSPREIMEKVVRFWDSHKANRHKMTTITPAVHMEQYSPDDNRYDLRPFLYPRFTWAYQKMRESVEGLEARGRGGIREDGKKVVKGD